MAHKPKDRFLVVTRAFEGLYELEPDAARRVKYAAFIGHYAKIEAGDKKEFYTKYVSRSPYKEEIMTLYKLLHEEGNAEGRITEIVELFKEGIFTARRARARLNDLAKRNLVPRELVDQALQRIPLKG